MSNALENPDAASSPPDKRTAELSPAEAPELSEPLGCVLTLFTPAFIAALIAVPLSFAVLSPPLKYVFNLDNEFDVLLLVVLPPVAALGGLLGGLGLRVSGTSLLRTAVASAVACLPALGLLLIDRLSILTPAALVGLSAVCGVGLSRVLFRQLLDRRERAYRAGTASTTPARSLFATLVAVCVTLPAAAALPAAGTRIHSLSAWFVVSLAVTATAWLTAVHPHNRIVLITLRVNLVILLLLLLSTLFKSL